MKTNYRSLKYCLLAILGLATATSCDKYLDVSPPSEIAPEDYLNREDQLAAYAIARYEGMLPSHGNWSFGTFGADGNTDNMVTPNLSARYLPGEWRVASEGGDWSFTNIFQMNYFLNRVIPLWKQGAINGSKESIDHYIGEIYYLRAL